MNVSALMPALLLLLFLAASAVGAGIVLFTLRIVSRERTRRKALPELDLGGFFCPPSRPSWLRRPSAWLAIKTRNVLAVQAALGLHNTKPCSWIEGLAGEEKLFIAPPVKGWTLVIGSGLPDPSEDVDACFRFVLELSRKLGHVQFFSASRIVHHHAWVRAEAGRILRAYAWAGRTLWKQGHRTAAEKELGLACLDYGDPGETLSFGCPEAIAANTDKVPLLASRWSLDPAEIDERLFALECGIAGEPSRRY